MAQCLEQGCKLEAAHINTVFEPIIRLCIFRGRILGDERHARHLHHQEKEALNLNLGHPTFRQSFCIECLVAECTAKSRRWGLDKRGDAGI